MSLDKTNNSKKLYKNLDIFKVEAEIELKGKVEYPHIELFENLNQKIFSIKIDKKNTSILEFRRKNGFWFLKEDVPVESGEFINQFHSYHLDTVIVEFEYLIENRDTFLVKLGTITNQHQKNYYLSMQVEPNLFEINYLTNDKKLLDNIEKIEDIYYQWDDEYLKVSEILKASTDFSIIFQQQQCYEVPFNSMFWWRQIGLNYKINCQN